MPSNARSGPARRGSLIARLIGYGLFFIAFFLPAVREVTPAGGPPPDPHMGYFCAWITLINTFNRDAWQSKDFLAILSGWINPLMLLYVAFLFSRRLRMPRMAIAAVIALLMVGTWVYFALAGLIPMIGHFMWIAGILLILSGEWVRTNSNQKDSAGAVPPIA
jgi:hypothetical protein